MKFKSACEKAMNYFQKEYGDIGFYSIKDLGDRWLFDGASAQSETIYDKQGITIDKNTGKLDFGYNFSYSNFSRYMNRSIKSLAQSLHIKSKVTYYSARKSFVQHGFELGISLEILEYCIGQSMKKNRPIFNYLRIMRDHADKAIRTILDNLL